MHLKTALKQTYCLWKIICCTQYICNIEKRIKASYLINTAIHLKCKTRVLYLHCQRILRPLSTQIVFIVYWLEWKPFRRDNAQQTPSVHAKKNKTGKRRLQGRIFLKQTLQSRTPRENPLEWTPCSFQVSRYMYKV